MSGVRVYIEGGGDSKEQKAALRRGFNAFLKELQDAVRAKGLKWHVILCGSRQSTYRDYQTALRDHHDSLNILLVDAEIPVAVIGRPWQHLAAQDNWRDPGVGDDYCHLMVQTVEAWLIADPDALEEYYGQGFRRNLLPGNVNVEAISRQDLLQGIEQASTHTQKRRYKKIHHCADLLAVIDVATVRRRAAHCDRLFTTVMRLIS